MSKAVLKFRSILSELQISRIPFILIPVTLLLNDRLNTLIIIIYSAAVIIQPNLTFRLQTAIRNRWVIPFLMLYFLYALSLIWTSNLDAGFYEMEKKAGLFALPLLFSMDRGLDMKVVHEGIRYFILTCALTLVACLIFAAYRIWPSGDMAPLFYHELGFPFQLNAIYFSVFIFSAICFLLFTVRSWFSNFRIGFWLILALLIVGIFLLSSRIFMILTILLFCYFFYAKFKQHRLWRKGKVLIIITLFIITLFILIG